MTSQRRSQTIAIHILIDISRKKSNQVMKFGYCFIEYKIRNIFLAKTYVKCGAETISRPVSKRSNLAICLGQ